MQLIPDTDEPRAYLRLDAPTAASLMDETFSEMLAAIDLGFRVATQTRLNTDSHLLEQMRVVAADLELLGVPFDKHELTPAKIACHTGDRLGVDDRRLGEFARTCSGSSSSISSLIGLRISASNDSVCTRVYFSSDVKNRISAVGISRNCCPTLACIHCRRLRCACTAGDSSFAVS